MTSELPVCGLRSSTGAMPPAFPLDCVKAFVPKKATSAGEPVIAPENFSLMGLPLSNVVMPDICQPFKSPFVNLLRKPERARSGKL